MSLIYIQQNGSEGQNTPYANKYYPSATIATGGCGCCSSLMVLLNSTNTSMTLSKWAKILIKGGARNGDGTNMSVVCDLMKKSYGFTYTITQDINKLKAHIKAGYKAVVNVGGKGYFSTGGHFVCVAGINKAGQAIVLDPYYYANKWTTSVNGINRANHFSYNSATHEVVCSFDTIERDARGLKYFLFTPVKNKRMLYSANDVKSVQSTQVAKSTSTAKSYKKWTGYVSASVLNVRAKASTSANILGTLAKNTAVTITGENGSFYAFNYKGKTAYISKVYVNKTKVSSIWVGTVVASALNIRAKASTSSKIIGVLKNGTKVVVTGSSGDFYIINLNNVTGYVAKAYIKKK